MVNALKEGYGMGQLPTFPTIVESFEVILSRIKFHDKKFDLYFSYRQNWGRSIKVRDLYHYLSHKLKREIQ